MTVARQAILLTRAARRDVLRAVVLRCAAPLPAPRASSLSAARSAVWAAFLSPLRIASSTLRTDVRMRERRIWLTRVRRSVWRARRGELSSAVGGAR